MASLNKSTVGAMRTTNKSGHAAYKLQDRDKLVTMALTTMLGESKYYGDNTDELIQLAESMCKEGDGLFVAKLAVWARTTGNMRSVSHALISVVAHECSGQPFVRPAVRRIASVRGDDGTEIIASHLALYGKKVKWPHALQRGVMDAMRVKTPFAVAKYQSASKEVKLRDVLRMTHPVPNSDELSDTFRACLDGTLPVPKSWETELSARGNTADVWNELIAENRVPFFACLRNLRNIIGSGADVDPVLKKISDPDAVHKSRVLPFRFFSAYRELQKAGLATTKVARAIDMALMASCDNVEGLEGRTAVLIDVSGSMHWKVSAHSDVQCRDIASVIGAIATHISDDAWVGWFNNNAGVIPMTGLSVLSDIDKVPEANGGTSMGAGFNCLIESGFDADRVIVLSDNEVNGGGFWSGDNKKVIQGKLDKYRRHVGHDVWCHAIDLQGYGTSQFIGPKVNIMAGWSEQVLRFVSMTEEGTGSLIDEILSLELD